MFLSKHLAQLKSWMKGEMNKGQVFVWLLTGLALAAGITLIGVGASFLISSTENDEMTCSTGSSNSYSYAANFDSRFMRLSYVRNEDQHSVLSVHMGQTASGDGDLTSYPRIVDERDNEDLAVDVTVTYTTNTDTSELSLSVNQINTGNTDITCYDTLWSTSNDGIPPTDCIPMIGYWFGGAEMYYQDWPINSWNKHMSFYLSGDMFSDAQQYGSVLERYWLSSEGVALYVPSDVPLHVSMEKQQICFKGSYENPYKTRNSNYNTHWLKYTTCFGRTPQIVHDYMFKTYFKRPNSLPDERMIKSPIWSTWARYKVYINESVILNYANEILDHGFSNSQLEIDDGYEVYYGDHTFDPEKFPDAAGMIDSLHDLNFRVTTWVTPFVNPRSSNYDNGDVNKYYILNGNTGESGRVFWWNGIGSSIDFTNIKACDWYSNLLENVRTTYGVDSYKFDAGEINYVTSVPDFKAHQSMENIGHYTQVYAECAHRLGTQIEIRAAWNCQHLPIFVRMMDKDSNWGREKGLETLIPTALTFSILGYPYVLPDMIGGNAYEDGFHGTPLPERELFIRWLEVTAFLPSMQFSYAPWQYDDVTNQIALDYVKLHETIVFEELKKASNDYISGVSGIGPIRPIWWVTVNDVKAFTIDDEFMVGDRYLVAPVIKNATRSRDIYLPGPLWRDGSQRIGWVDKLRSNAPVYLGGTTIQNYLVELDEISWWELTLIK